MLSENGVLKMLPQLEKKAKHLSEQELLREGVKIYRSFPGGRSIFNPATQAIAIGVEFIEDI